MHEAKTENDMEWMRVALHDLCQPLTALGCGLFLGTMSSVGGGPASSADMRETILAALVQCERATGKLRAIQQRMQG